MEEQTDMITLCCPSRGRPTLAKRMYDKAMEFASKKDHVEVYLYLNEDDPTRAEYLNLFRKCKHVRIDMGPHQSTSYSWNQLATNAKHDLVCLIGDDVQIETPAWEKQIYDMFNRYNDKILMVVPNTDRLRGYTQKQLKSLKNNYWPNPKETLPSPHFVVHKNWIKALGYMCPYQFWHFYVDSYTQKVARQVGRCVFVRDIKFRVKKMEDDTATQVRTHMNIRNRDDWAWKSCQRHLQSDVATLKNFIDNFKL